MTYPHQIDAGNTNGALWNEMSTTDPDSTKRVSMGQRSFTAIDAYAQIKAATAKWGPVGEGWGWTVKETTVAGEGVSQAVIVTIEIWWGPTRPGIQRNTFSAIGCEQLLKAGYENKPPRMDTDAPKKALTDAITKGLSYLGFNADVFFGAFDDNKYVQQLQAEKKQGKASERDQPRGETEAQAKPAEKQASTGSPPWAGELIGGGGRFSKKPWGYLLEGGIDGGRHGWMRAAFPNYSDKLIRVRLAWILEKYYSDLEARDGTLDKAAAAKKAKPELAHDDTDDVPF